MALEDTSDEELLARAEQLVQQYVAMAPEIASQLERFGRMRYELQLLTTEIEARNLPFEHAQDTSTE